MHYLLRPSLQLPVRAHVTIRLSKLKKRKYGARAIYAFSTNRCFNAFHASTGKEHCTNASNFWLPSVFAKLSLVVRVLLMVGESRCREGFSGWSCDFVHRGLVLLLISSQEIRILRGCSQSKISNGLRLLVKEFSLAGRFWKEVGFWRPRQGIASDATFTAPRSWLSAWNRTWRRRHGASSWAACFLVGYSSGTFLLVGAFILVKSMHFGRPIPHLIMLWWCVEREFQILNGMNSVRGFTEWNSFLVFNRWWHRRFRRGPFPFSWVHVCKVREDHDGLTMVAPIQK